MSLTIATFFVQLQFLFILRYNRTISLMFATLKQAKFELGTMCLVLTVVIVAFGTPQLLIIGHKEEGYSTVMKTIMTQLSSALGVFKHAKARSAAVGVLSDTFFLVYLLTSMLFVVNMFVTLLNIFITTLKSDKSIQPKDHEVIDYLLDQVKSFITTETVAEDVDVEEGNHCVQALYGTADLSE